MDSLVQGGPAWESSANGGLQVILLNPHHVALSALVHFQPSFGSLTDASAPKLCTNLCAVTRTGTQKLSTRGGGAGPWLIL